MKDIFKILGLIYKPTILQPEKKPASTTRNPTQWIGNAEKHLPLARKA